MDSNRILSLNTIPENIKSAQYAVRGELLLRANQHEHDLQTWRENLKKDPSLQPPLPFEELIYCNIGNPQALEQQPITFFRQLLSLVEYPQLMQHEQIASIFPQDVIERAKKSLSATKGGMGAYSHSKGLEFVRNDIANFIQRRDGFPADPEDIFIYNGASPAVQTVLQLLLRSSADGILVPIPQYPLYSASITLFGGTLVGYYLDENKGWGLDVVGLEQAYNDAAQKGVQIRGIVVINPGNPTGQILSEENMKQIIDFCHKKRLVLMADEVYQENIYTPDKKFISFKKVLKSLGEQYNTVEMFSFHSISKGFTGECGHRGGYLEAVGIDQEILAQMYKLSSINLCPNTAGQLLIDVMVNPPKEGDASYPLYLREKVAILESLKRRAQKLTTFLNKLEGVSCTVVEGAMYAFPSIQLPKKAVEAALAAKKQPDVFYCIQALDATGLCVVPGSGFGQKDGSFHFRTTILPPEDKIDAVLSKLAVFHQQFLTQYKD